MDMLKISKANLYRLMSTGIIKYVKLGGRTLFKESELSEFIDSLGAKEKVNHRKTGTKSDNIDIDADRYDIPSFLRKRTD